MPEVPSYFHISPGLLKEAQQSEKKPRSASRPSRLDVVPCPRAQQAEAPHDGTTAVCSAAAAALAEVSSCKRFPRQPGSLSVCHAGITHSKAGRTPLSSRTPILRAPKHAQANRSLKTFAREDNVGNPEGTEYQRALAPSYVNYYSEESKRAQHPNPMYCFTGAAIMGNAGIFGAYLRFSQAYPGLSYAIDIMQFAMQNAMPNIRQLIMLGLMPRLLTKSPAEDTIVGGLSLGGWPVYETTTLAEESMHGLRMACVFDDRRRHPDPYQRAAMKVAANTSLNEDENSYFANVGREFAKMWTTTYVSCCCQQGVRQFMMHSYQVLFVTPLMLDHATGAVNEKGSAAISSGATALFDDEKYYPRLPLYSKVGELWRLPDADHFTITTGHAWDINRRMRGSLLLAPHHVPKAKES